MARTVTFTEGAWRVSRQPPVAAGARASGDHDVVPQEGGLWFHSDTGEVRFLPMGAGELPSEEELADMPMDRITSLFRQAERRVTPDSASRERRFADTADRLAVSATRLALSYIPGAGPVLAEALTLARELSEARDAEAARVALERRVEGIGAQFERLKAAGRSVVRFSGDRARLLQLTVAYENEHVVPGLERDEAMQKLGLTREVWFDAAKELATLGAVDAQGYARTISRPDVFVQVVGQVVPGVDVRRELAQLLAVFTRPNEGRVPREWFADLPIPTPRAQHLLEFLKARELIDLLYSGTSTDELLFGVAELLPHGKRVLRGDEDLPDA